MKFFSIPQADMLDLENKWGSWIKQKLGLNFKVELRDSGIFNIRNLRMAK